MMPKMSGEEVCQRIRLKSKVPIIMLTAKVEENDVIQGIKGGADDYIKKPFSVRELMVRVAAIFRRTNEEEPMLSIYSFNDNDLIVNFNAMTVKKKGEEVTFTPNEFKILKTLISNAEIILSREQIIEKTFGINFDGFDRTIDTHIKNIRAKIEENPKKPLYVKTIYSMGYKFYPEFERDCDEKN
jgi:DNA-binding response OmpR family regulator